jgi:hypothetical protein
LVILCGDNGEKVELFAGTYRTALSLSRTFILPDSPRSMELQLQGDDLVEVFLVFSQNVFGLEPATVRVREVGIGRAERRAARRRARQARAGELTTEPEETQIADDVSVNLNIGFEVPTPSNSAPSGDLDRASPELGDVTPVGEPITLSPAEDLVALASTRMGPYTTFQQLSFAPKFPLASIADGYVIPPTYPDVLKHRAEHEPETLGNGTEVDSIQISPPGLPVPPKTPPSKWLYRDPKNVVHGK